MKKRDRDLHFGNRKELGLVPAVEIAQKIGVTRSAITQADQQIFLKLAHAIAPLSFPPWHILKDNNPLKRELYPQACRLLVPILHKIFSEEGATFLGKVESEEIVKAMRRRTGRRGGKSNE